MERSEAEKPTSEEGSQLNRNRSFKTKQLVRSQAIRESASPPRTISPACPVEITNNVTATDTVTNNVINNGAERAKDDCSVASCDGDELKKQPVEIQITSGHWDEASPARRRTGGGGGEPARDLLSHNPRVHCVCGACAQCPHCRGRRRRPACIKQDSGIACADDCPDCCDNDHGGQDGLRKSESVEIEEQIYYCRCPERKEKPKYISLSRTDSDDKAEPSGPELICFLKETLNKNGRDRVTLLRIEKELHALVNDSMRCIVRFPVMSSYGRMLVHRCAALFQLAHHPDPMNKNQVVVSKSGTCGGRIPCTSFRQWCTVAFPPSPRRHQTVTDTTNAKSILKRDTHSLDEPGNGSLANSRSKSLEQRERDYERMKRRIFSTDNCSQDESQWPWLGAPVKVLTPEINRNKLLKVQSLESSALPARGGGCSRRGVAKSHSFGGYAQPAPAPKPLRLLSRQGDLASSSWRLSPSSSGYKTLSLRSTDSVTPSPTSGASPEPCFVPPACQLAPRCVPGVVWCVTDLSRVPPGAWLLHPQTGRPLSNPDGSVYRYDPNNPPVLDETYHLEDDQIDQNDKKRGKLEKQDSFIDHGECDCPPPEETRNKCCCECRQQDASQRDADKHTSDEKQEPRSPCKNNYESNNQDSEQDIQKSAENNFECDTQYSPQLAYESYEGYEQAETVADQGAQYDTLADQNQAYEAADNQSGQQFNSASPRTQQFDPNNQKTQQFDANSKRTQQFDTNNQKTKHFDTTSQRTQQFDPDNQKAQQFDSAGQRTQQQFDPINQIAHQYDPTNQKVHQFDPNNQATHQFDPATKRTHQFDQNNQRTQQFDPNNQISQQFDTNINRTQPYELTSQRTPQFEPASQRTPQFEPANQLAQSEEAKANQDSHEIQYNQYAVRTDEVTSPPESQPCQPTELAHQSMAQAKATPVPIPDPHLRPMSINNVVYPTMHQGYPYINQCRMEPTMPVYQQVLGPPEDAKQMTSPPHQEPTFRIDPSYPYAAVDYAAQCGACVDPNAMRSYNLPYGQMEIPQAVLPPAYPVGNVIIPQPHIQYPYQEAAQWAGGALVPLGGKLILPEPYPALYHQLYQCGLVYPPVMPAPSPVWAPEPRPAPPPRPHCSRASPARRDSDEIAVKIQQIKEQMAELNTREKERGTYNKVESTYKGPPREEWRKRNNGSGILGNYPHGFQGRTRFEGRPPHDDSQLTSAARAIVNSIRNMQAKNTYHDNRRSDYNSYRPERPDYRRREREPDAVRTERPDADKEPRRFERAPFQYRAPYAFRQMTPGTWCRRSPGPMHPVLNHPRRPHPDTRNPRR